MSCCDYFVSLVSVFVVICDAVFINFYIFSICVECSFI